MKTKVLLFCIICSLVPFITLHCQNASNQDTNNEEHIKSMLKNFYTSYIQECSKVPNDLKGIGVILNKYCTENLQQEIKNPELDYDPLLDAQFCDPEWLKTLTISKDTTVKNDYYIAYNYIINNQKRNKRIKLSIVKEADGYKINHVFLNDFEE